jgi:Tfp pilus assembly protein PilF
VLEGTMKYIHGPKPELYDLGADPDELHDLARERPAEVSSMREELESLLDRLSIAGTSSTEAVDPEVRRRLESLGYLNSTVATAGQVIVEQLRSDGVAPRDRVGDINDVSAAKHLLFAGRSVDALPYTQKLLRQDPDNPFYVELCASALLGSGHLEQAWEAAGTLVSDGSLSEPLMLSLTGAEFERGDRRTALEALRSYLVAQPSAQGAWRLASFYKRLGDSEHTREALLNALELDGKFAPARVDLAVWLAQAGEDVAAETEFLQALDDDPYFPRASYNYGTFLLHDARNADAAACFRRAIALAPRYLEAYAALVAAYIGDGQRAEAEAVFRSLQQLAPSSPATATAEKILASP